MKHALRAAGHECDRFVVRGLECPFRKIEEEDEEEPDEDPDDKISFPQVLPVPARRDRGADAVRGANVVDFRNAVAQGETRKALERMAAFQNLGGLQFVPDASRLTSALQGNTAQGIMAVLAALATIAALRRGRAGTLRTQSLGVAQSERGVAMQLSARDPVIEFQGRSRRAIRKFFGFGPTAGVDTFSETGFN